MARERAVLFIDGSNFYHSAKRIGVATGDLNYQALAHKLVLDRRIAEIRYYVGKVSGEIYRVVQQEKFLNKLRSRNIAVDMITMAYEDKYDVARGDSLVSLGSRVRGNDEHYKVNIRGQSIYSDPLDSGLTAHAVNCSFTNMGGEKQFLDRERNVILKRR